MGHLSSFVSRFMSYTSKQLATDMAKAGVEHNTVKDPPGGCSDDFTGYSDGVYYVDGCPQTYDRDTHHSVVTHGEDGHIQSCKNEGDPWW